MPNPRFPRQESEYSRETRERTKQSEYQRESERIERRNYQREIIEQWRADAQNTREHLTRLTQAVEKLVEETSAVLGAFRATGQFMTRWGWLLGFLVASLLGISPTAFKAILAASGHPVGP